MAYVTGIDETHLSGRSALFSARAGLCLTALTVTSIAIAWIWDSREMAAPGPASPTETSSPSFEDRFRLGAMPSLLSKDFSVASTLRLLPPEIELKLQQAKSQLAEDLRTKDWQSAFFSKPAASSAAAIPLPRPRPAESSYAWASSAPPPAVAPPTNERSFLQKLSDLIPAKVTLASLEPDGGVSQDGLDLGALGYDSVTAVYDISARAVYLPSGVKLEAHSGLGALMDDPQHVNARNVGATPPNTYDLKPRERLFHGVQALRMLPQDGSGTLGRDGLLAHSYMLGPNGDSNGCVSIKAYDRFLRAYQNGEIKRLVVVVSLKDAGSTPRKSLSQL